jgi:UDP-3-O-[3-hydroxymyristoyl] glucosamine N-acyltransferase
MRRPLTHDAWRTQSFPGLLSKEATMPKVHSTAIVDPKAWLDEDVEIGPYCVVSGGAMIG